MRLKIGLTGNIGSGKSLVARIFEVLKIPVYFADVEAKNILDSTEVMAEIIKLFGSNLIVNNSVDKKALAQIVFSDKSKLKQLNQIIHPAVRENFTSWAEVQDTSPYVIYEAAILHESGHYQNMDKTIVVSAKRELRLKRVMQRDNATEEMVIKRMKNQWAEERKIALADFVVNNNQTELLIPQVMAIHEILTQST